MTLSPRLDILPAAQRRLWPALAPAANLGFVLYGGTAIALRLGHRLSVDFDFFSERPLDRMALFDSLPFLGKATVLQDERNTLTLLVSHEADSTTVKLSFFGLPEFARIGEPDITDDGIMWVASLDDLMATKLKVILQRAEAKDYRDIASMIHADVSLPKGLAAARAIFGPTFQPSESLKALVYFEDGDLQMLTKDERTTLAQAASAVRELPEVQIRSHQLHP